MRQQATAWVTGNVGTVPEGHGEGPSERVKFRLLTTPRRWDRTAGAWLDGQTTGTDVTCWNELARNVIGSVRKGDPLIVHGRLEESRWTDREGVSRRSVQLVAELVGHDLSRGTAAFTRTPRGLPASADDEHPGSGAPAATDAVVDPFDQEVAAPEPEGAGAPF